MQDAVTFVSINMRMSLKEVLRFDHISFGKLYHSCVRVRARDRLETMLCTYDVSASCSMGSNEDTVKALKEKITALQIEAGIFKEEPEEQVTPASQIPCGM